MAALDQSAGGQADPPEIPAATVVVARDGADDLEVLMLRRASTTSFAPGAWVFPGGQVDVADAGDDKMTSIAAARRALVRETREETGLELDGDSLSVISRWIPGPPISKRFTTWILFGTASAADVVVDGSEIIDHRWLSPSVTLAEHGRGKLVLLPPTWVTLYELSRYRNVAEARATIDAAPIAHYDTHVARTETGYVCLWRGDEGFEAGDPELAGTRHRLYVADDGPWSYQRDEGV
ncbi:NUDIX hydrolase [Mycobacterium sp. E796]|nr:NUDIX hydrolase [Mycobacterium sp. E796]